MSIQKGIKIIGAAIVPTLIFAQTAMAAPVSIYYQDASLNMVSVNYQTVMMNKALNNPSMYNALNTAFLNAEIANRPIVITDDSGKTINWAGALNANETYPAALNDSAVNNATVPTATKQMNADGTVTATSMLTVNGVGAVSGTAKVGVQLTAGALTPAGATASYQWQICSTATGVYTNISGATTNNYTPVAGDATKYVKVVVTGTGSYSGTVSSAATGPVANADVPVVVGTPINLGTAGNYAILAETGISSAPPSVITGDIGDGPAAASYITGFSLTAVGTYSTSPQVTGKIYAADYTPPTPSNLTTAVSDMQTAYTNAAGRTADYNELYSGDLSGKTLNAGVYKWGNSVLINSDVTLHGGANDVFVFEIAGGITQAANTKVILTGGVQAKNIFWQSAQTVSIGTGAHFEGIVLSMTNITLKTGASINGRLLAQTAVTLDQSTVTAPGL